MKDIKQILDKYYKGETSIDEELQLKEYLRQSIRQQDVPNFEKAMFEFFESEKKDELDEDFDEKILNRITSQKVKLINYSRNKVYYRLAGIAAVVLLAFGYYFIFFDYNFDETKKINMTENEKFALKQTIETLTMVSGYLNVANDEMEGLSIINSSLETINKVSDFEQYDKYILNILGEGT